ncbi:MAG: BrnT family toxin [Candidatus Hydrogenedentes bacterium]|nr:BrnT family toxin [Candidatus Hydrogenedentota bacterium]
MEFEWDSAKARANVAKHGVRFADATTVLSDTRAVTVLDEHPLEDRFVTIGMDSLGRILVVVYTWRGDVVRMISARRATRHERSAYERSDL